MENPFEMTQLFGPDGTLLAQGAGSGNRFPVDSLPEDAPRDLLAQLYGKSPLHPRVSGKQIYQVAEDLQFLDRKGAEKGFYHILPNAHLLNRIMESFNRQHLNALGAEQVTFPMVFDRMSPGLQSLTADYEAQGRIFPIGTDGKKQLRLAYAADPGLFSWLSQRRFSPESIPLALYSPTQGFRKWKKGELGLLNRYNQYLIPDLHLLTEPQLALEKYLQCVRLNAEFIRFWMEEDWCHLLETDVESLTEMPGLGSWMAREIGQYTLMRVYRKRPRYYNLKSGFMVNAGYQPLMFYNLQLDDTNGERFDIRLQDGIPLTILHATVAGSWPKILPIFIGRALAGLRPRSLPLEWAPTQVAVLPVQPEDKVFSEAFARQLESTGLRVKVESPDRPLGRRLKSLRQQWQSHYTVIGAAERQGKTPLIESPGAKGGIAWPDFIRQNRKRLDRCRPSDNRVPRSFSFKP